MERIICLFQKYNITITAMLMASGKAWNSLNIDTSLSEYTTKSPSTAAGKTLPRYFIYEGVSLFAGKTIKGKNLVIIVEMLRLILL